MGSFLFCMGKAPAAQKYLRRIVSNLASQHNAHSCASLAYSYKAL
ncbi:hypothetical protein B194_4643 [Serratia plymuthica A30]|nr:hypothetical protein B194_4643 [Serratia plymuthica A30]